MSKRRQEGDKVWLAERGGCVGSSICQQGTIHDRGSFSCMLDCGDDDCWEWDNVLGADGSWSYHVTECDMFDTEAEALEASKEHPMGTDYVKAVDIAPAAQPLSPEEFAKYRSGEYSWGGNASEDMRRRLCVTIDARDEEIARLRDDSLYTACVSGHGKQLASCVMCRWDVNERVAKLEAEIKWFLSLTRKLTPGDTPEQAVWHVPDRELMRLGEALKP